MNARTARTARTATGVIVLGSLVALTGCKGHLVIKDTNGNDIDGVRVAVPMIVREHILYTMHSEEGPNCKHAADYRYAAIPSAQH